MDIKCEVVATFYTTELAEELEKFYNKYDVINVICLMRNCLLIVYREKGKQ